MSALHNLKSFIPVIVCLGITLHWCILPVSAEVYKWVDKDGKVHYGDKPPNQDAPAEEIKIPEHKAPPPSQPLDRQQHRNQLIEALSAERTQKEEAAKQAALEKEQAQQRCVHAKDRLRQYTEAGFLYDLDKNGERVVLSDAQHEQTLQKARAEVDKWCR